MNFCNVGQFKILMKIKQISNIHSGNHIQVIVFCVEQDGHYARF